MNITYNIYIYIYGDGFDEMYFALVSEKQKKSLSFSGKALMEGAIGFKDAVEV